LSWLHVWAPTSITNMTVMTIAVAALPDPSPCDRTVADVADMPVATPLLCLWSFSSVSGMVRHGMDKSTHSHV
jgi:hypothetical protein